MAEQNPKKKHHYIPVFYLNGFTDANGCVWAYKKDDSKVLESTPEGIAYSNDYFSFITPNGNKDSETIENIMADLEAVCAPVIKKILSFETISDNDRYTFCAFVAMMMLRSPNFRNNVETTYADMTKHLGVFSASNKTCFESMIERCAQETGTDFGTPEQIEKLRQSMLKMDEHYKIKTNPQVSLKTSLGFLKDFPKRFYMMKWIFLKATDDHKYLTGDNPFYYCDPTHDKRTFYGVGLATKKVEITLPLSKNLLALGSWESHSKSTYLPANNRLVKEINRRTVISCWRMVFASSKSDGIRKLVSKYKDTYPKMAMS